MKESKVYVMSREEFLEWKRFLPKKQLFLSSMTPISYCKIETYKECLFGTMYVPKGMKEQICIYTFGFYLSGQELYFVGEEDFLVNYFDKMCEEDFAGYRLGQFLTTLLEHLLQEEVLYLQQQEEELARLEEQLIKEMPEYFYERIMVYRKRFNLFHAYYEQLMNMADIMLASVNGTKFPEEMAQWQLFSARAERLHDHVKMLREYVVQIRELYQSLSAVRQNKVMSMLTVVTTVFLPLTLIAGWYGMNFPNMPELGWKYAYPAVIIVSAAVILLEVIYFKKKKML